MECTKCGCEYDPHLVAHKQGRTLDTLCCPSCGAGPRRPGMAYVAVVVEDGYRPGIAKEGEPGYYRVHEDSDAGGLFDSYEEAAGAADAYNERLGLTKREAALIVASTMRGEGRRGS